MTAETNLPNPMTPRDCDLRDFAFMPLDVVRLFSSDFHATANDAEWRAGVTLWCRAWHQVPSGSLPDNDVALARLAEFGRDVASWGLVKGKALHGWVKCSDGRLYHPVVAGRVLEAWIEKLGQRKSSAAGNAKRWKLEFDPAGINSQIREVAAMLTAVSPQSRTLQKRTALAAHGVASGSPDGNPEDGPDGHPDGNADAIPEPIPSGSQGTGTGTGTGNLLIPLLRNGQATPAASDDGGKPPKASTPPGKGDPWAKVYHRGREVLGGNAGGIITLLRHHYRDNPNKVLGKLDDAAAASVPIEYVGGFLRKVADTLPAGSFIPDGRVRI